MSSTIFQQACASWFDRQMCSGLSGRAQTVAYGYKQCFNEVTHDAWPSQGWLSDKYAVSTKTIQRGANDLEEAGAIAVITSRRQRVSNRCAPLFLSVDWDTSDQEARQLGPGQQDRSVRQSSLSNPPNSSFPLTPEMIRQISLRHYALKSKIEPYNNMKRAGLEMQVAKKLGFAAAALTETPNTGANIARAPGPRRFAAPCCALDRAAHHVRAQLLASCASVRAAMVTVARELLRCRAIPRFERC